MWVSVEMISCFWHRSNKRQAPLEAEWSLCTFSGIFQSEGTQSPWFTLAPRVKTMPALAFHSAPVLSVRMRKSILCLRAFLFSWFRPGAHARLTLFSVWFVFFLMRTILLAPGGHSSYRNLLPDKGSFLSADSLLSTKPWMPRLDHTRRGSFSLSREQRGVGIQTGKRGDIF